MDKNFSLGLLTGCPLKSGAELYTARPAKRFARPEPISPAAELPIAQ
jgi:hypothetical protein